MDCRKDSLRENWMDFDQFKAKFQNVPVEEFPNNVIKSVPKPEISVRITTYQHAPYIRQAIESVLMQELDVPWEIIIGDDESTDGTREICIEYAKKYPDLIRLFLHRRGNNIRINERPTHLFQYCYNSYHLRGKYVAGCSGDDEWTDEYKLQMQYNLLVNDSDLSWCSTNSKIVLIDSYGNIVEERVSNKEIASSRMHINFFEKIPIRICNSINEDTFMRAILFTYGGNVQITNVKPIIYRRHANNMWSKRLLDDDDKKYQSRQKLRTRREVYLTYIGTIFAYYFKHQYYRQLFNYCKLDGLNFKAKLFYFLSICNLAVYKFLKTVDFRNENT